MTETDIELLSQYLDGELPSAERKALEQRLAVEEDLHADLERLRAVDASIRAAFRDQDKVPAQIAALLAAPDSGVVPFPRRGRTVRQYALAASLVAAVGLVLTGDWLATPPAGAPDPQLSRLLEASPSRGDGWELMADGRRIRPVLSYATADGSWCREFLLAEEGASYRGVACRHGGVWETRALQPANAGGSADQYRPAGAGDADAIAAFMADHAAGIPLSASAEAELIARGWE
jgi:hypothetical protein